MISRTTGPTIERSASDRLKMNKHGLKFAENGLKLTRFWLWMYKRTGCKIFHEVSPHFSFCCLYASGVKIQSLLLAHIVQLQAGCSFEKLCDWHACSRVVSADAGALDGLACGIAGACSIRAAGLSADLCSGACRRRMPKAATETRVASKRS